MHTKRNLAILFLRPAISGYSTPWLVKQEALMAYFFMWGLFTLLMFFGTLKTNRALQFVFMSLAILFFLLAAKSAILVYSPTTDVATIHSHNRS